MHYIHLKISGVPYPQKKVRGNVKGMELWTNVIIEQTAKYQKIKAACILNVTFLLPPNKFPSDCPYGPDLDNLLKRFLDALNRTIFSSADGKDSCVISMTVKKTKVSSEKDAGAILEILPVSLEK